VQGWRHQFKLRLKALFQREALDRDLDEELAFHLAMREKQKRSCGISEDEVPYAARRQFGNYTQAKERTRSMWTFPSAENIWRDVRFGWRVLVKSPGFTAVAILTLALGIGANTAIFSFVYAALLRPLPYARPAELLTLGEYRPQQAVVDPADAQNWVVSYPDYLDWAKQSKAFNSLAGFNGDGFIYRGAGEPHLFNAAQVTTNFFTTLGVVPILGRDFAPGEDVAEGPKVVMLTYSFWMSEFAGDRNVLGRSIRLDANNVTIIGVLPREFQFAPTGSAQVWVPLHLDKYMRAARNLRWMPVIGRLAAHLTPAQARSEMESINSSLASAYTKDNGSILIAMVPLRDRIVGRVQLLLLVLFAAVGLVLLIACANVANLLLVRAASRRREFAIRAALGAPRSRLVSQLMAESLLLSLAAAGLALLLARGVTYLLVAAIPEPLLNATPFFRDLHINPVVMAFLCGVAVLTGVAFGVSPALQVSQARAGDALKEESRTSAGNPRVRLRHTFVVAEIAFSLVLLVCAGLLIKSLNALLHRDPGFDPNNLATFFVNLPTASYPNDPDAIHFDERFTERAAAVPGILGVASTSIIPLTGGGNTIRFVLEGESVAAGQESECDIRDISSNYFSVMRIPLTTGRFFNKLDDGADSPRHLIVNQSFVDHFLHGQNPLSKRLRFTFSDKQPYREIVGVVSNAADSGLDSPPEPALFVPFAQGPNTFINYLVRAQGNPADAVNSMRAALHDVDPQLVVLQPQSMAQIIDQSPSVFLRRYPSYLIGSFAGLALLLATIGLYGLVSYSVAQRTREFGVRIALGAGQRELLRLVLTEGARLALLGVGIGLLAAFALTGLLRSLLFGVRPADPLTFAGVALFFVTVALVACYVPARRATRVDPMVALRYE